MAITRDKLGALNATTDEVDSFTITWESNPASGAKVLVWFVVGSDDQLVSSVKDNGATQSTFSEDADYLYSDVGYLYVYRADGITNPASGSYEVTVTLSSESYVTGAGYSYLGVKTGGPTETNHDSAATGSSVATGDVTPDNAGALFFAGTATASDASDETITLTNDAFTEQATETDGAVSITLGLADYIDSGGPAATECTWTLSDSTAWAGLIAAYDAAESGVTVDLTVAQVEIEAYPVILPVFLGLPVAQVHVAAYPPGLPSPPVTVSLAVAQVHIAAPAPSPSVGTRKLIMSIAPVAGTDQYGNSYPAGFYLYGANQAVAYHLGLATGGTNENTASRLQPYILNQGEANEYYTSVYASAVNANQQDQAYIALFSAASDGSAPSSGTLYYQGSNGSENEIGYWDYTGLTLWVARRIYAVAPGSGTSSTNPAISESWHTLSLGGSWTVPAGRAAPQYRLLPDGNVQLTGFAVYSATFTSNTTLGTIGTSAYQPATTKSPTQPGSGSAGVQISTAGVISAVPASGGSTQVSLDGIIYCPTV